MAESQVLDSEGAARLLHCSQAMACELAASGALPATMIGGQWLFVTDQVLDYLRKLALEGQAQRREAVKVVALAGPVDVGPARPGRKRRAPVDLKALVDASDRPAGGNARQTV